MHVKLKNIFIVFMVPLFSGYYAFSNPVHYAKGTAAYNEVGCSICKMHNNAGYLIAGYRDDTATVSPQPPMIWVVKVNNNGYPVDTAGYRDGVYGCKAKAIQPTNDGRYILCGWQQRGTNLNFHQSNYPNSAHFFQSIIA